MLSPIDDAPSTGSSSNPKPPKTIVVRLYSGSTTLMYQVPEGRKFVGHAGSFANTGTWFFVTPSGQTVNNGTTSIQKYSSYFRQGSTNNSYWQSDRPMTLHAGDMIHSDNQGGNGNWMILGEETDV